MIRGRGGDGEGEKKKGLLESAYDSHKRARRMKSGNCFLEVKVFFQCPKERSLQLLVVQIPLTSMSANKIH